MGRTVSIAVAELCLLWFAAGAADVPAADAAKLPAEARSVEQHGITWQFAEPVRVGRYVTGDWWVIGPVTVRAIDPAPAPGRNGAVVNPPAGYDPFAGAGDFVQAMWEAYRNRQ